MIFAVIEGYLGRDPEMRTTSSGHDVCDFSVGCSTGRDDTTWVRVNVWGKQAQVVSSSLRKGSFVIVSGTLALTEYTARDGTPRAGLEMRADHVRFGPRSDVATSGKKAASREDEDEIQF